MDERGLLDRWMQKAWLTAAPTTAFVVALQDPGRAQALADAQLLADWPQLLQGLLRQAHPLHDEILSPLPALHY
jgi:hypothetical protein